ncbi:LPP20 family lipoprotein [Ichthyobacterium seriolicida]|uniref:LPP20 lipoprotein n=1 Tax=Ichthyobacterium seriolicida TaxID=242600 RepID=A0A1J1E9X2_9FLAO|nr:LPP20 family lipoprotein [Ichthyobacterium seriolicida]BAV94320.1 hypothetical protein JBKA6_0307 [Ichthyobacterium seriolicida]
MKIKIIKSLGVVVFVSLFICCGGSKPVIIPNDEIDVVIPCSGKEFFTDGNHFRSNSVGESLDQMVAKKKALANARQQLASDISTVIKSVTDNYVKSSEFNNKEEALERFEQNGRSVVSQQLRGVRQICEKPTRVKSTGKYKYYVAIELSASDLVSAYNEVLSNDENLKVDYNYEKFKETFEEEMKKIGQ